jgi:hypothetical protein
MLVDDSVLKIYKTGLSDIGCVIGIYVCNELYRIKFLRS